MSQAWTHPARGTVQAQTKGSVAVTNDTDTTTTTATHPVVVHHDDGSLSLSTPFSVETWTARPAEPLTHDQRRAVLHLAFLRVMEDSAQRQLPEARLHLARVEREGWAESSVTYAREQVAELEQRKAAFAEAAIALEALLWGEDR